MKKTWGAAALALAASLLSLPCQKRAGIKGLDLAVTFSRRDLTDDLYVDVTSKWKLSRDFPGFDENRRLFFRFRHGDELLVEDAFLSDVPVSEWEPGEEYEFTRRIYIPRFVDEYDPGFRGSEPVILTVGLSGGRLDGEDSETVVLRRRLRISPAPLTPAILFVDGWSEPLRDLQSGTPAGRWTGASARCLIDNPKRDALLVLRGEADLESVPGQEITIRIDGTVLERFVPAERGFEKSYQISKEVLGSGRDFFLEISVDRTFLPAELGPGSEGSEERGVLISFIYFR